MLPSLSSRVSLSVTMGSDRTFILLRRPVSYHGERQEGRQTGSDRKGGGQEGRVLPLGPSPTPGAPVPAGSLLLLASCAWRSNPKSRKEGKVTVTIPVVSCLPVSYHGERQDFHSPILAVTIVTQQINS